MSIQATIRLNFTPESLAAQAEEMAVEAIKNYMRDVAIEVAKATPPLPKGSTGNGESPVDTGAYIESHTLVPSGSSMRRSKSSRNKPKKQDPEFHSAVALDNLYSDIDNNFPDIESVESFMLINGSRHAQKVEAKYLVYEKIRRMF
jgi:hypothetical protein